MGLQRFRGKKTIVPPKAAGQAASTTPGSSSFPCQCGHTLGDHAKINGQLECQDLNCVCASFVARTTTTNTSMTASTTTCTCRHHEADHKGAHLHGQKTTECLVASCTCKLFDSAYYADVMDTCTCKHERGIHWNAGMGHCLSKNCVCAGFRLKGKVSSPGPAGTRTSQPAYPPKGPLAGGLGSGKPSMAGMKVRTHASSGPYSPTQGINIYQDPSKHWDVIIEFEVAYGATPINHHMVELRLNIEREHAEVLLDGHELLDPAVAEAQIAAIRERILTEGSWAVARDTLTTDPVLKNFEVSPSGGTNERD